MAEAEAAVRAETWAQRYDRAAAEQVGDGVVAAAQFLRPRGWKAFGHALTDGPVGLLQRARGRPSQVRLPVALLVAVTEQRVHLLTTRRRPGEGPVPYPTGTLAEWERAQLVVEADVEQDGTRLTLSLEEGPQVELHGPPDELTARVVEALTGRRQPCDVAAPTAPAAPVLVEVEAARELARAS